MKMYLIATLAALSLPCVAVAGDQDAPVQTEVVEAQSGTGSGDTGRTERPSSDLAAGAWDKTKETSERAWAATKEGVSSAAEYTYRKAGEAWEATKKGTGKAIRWTSEKSGRAWEATKEGAGKAAEWTRDQSGQAWDATRDTAGKTGDAVKRGYEKAKKKTEEMVDGE